MIMFLRLTLILFISFSNAKSLVGLKNYGETCYANAVFQLLYRNKDFRRSLGHYLETNQNSNLQALHEIFETMSLAPDGSTVEPDTFKALPSNFTPGVQYDVAEVLAKYQEIPGFDWSPFAIKLKDTKSSPSRSRILEVEFDLELFLKIPKKEPVCLDDLLQLHFSHKIIQSISNNLIIRIKRLRNVNGVNKKIISEITIPQIISLQQFSDPPASSSSSSQFQLDSFIEHCGNCSDGGHYLFYFHKRKSDEYFAINDDNVQKISKEDYLKQASQAYLFLYRQIEQ
jgi:hypothetical protein